MSPRLFVAIACLAGLGLGHVARAAEPDSLDHMDGTAEEKAGWVACKEDRWVAAREKGEAIIKANPDSFAGHLILGMALHRGEGDLARALYHLETSRRLYDARFNPPNGASAPWRWHGVLIMELGLTLGEMDRATEQLEALDTHDRYYGPPRLASRIWPLMKLKRYDEARAAAAAAVATGDPAQRKHARADLCGAESEAGDRQRAYAACVEATTDFRDPASNNGMLEFSNAADASLEVFHYDEAERYLKEAVKRPPTIGWVNPYQQMTELYLTEGRIPEAIEAMKAAQELRLTHPAALDQYSQAKLDQALSELFLLVGVVDHAHAAAVRAVERPDRQGHSSGDEAQAQAGAAILHAAVMRDRAERHAEQALTADVFAAARLRARAVLDRLEAWRARRRAGVMLSDETFLVKSLRPYYLGITLPMWLMPDVVDAVGGGVALKGLGAALAVENHPGAARFFEALEAEAAYERRRCDDVVRLAEKALVDLPQAEVLLRARMDAIAGACADERGELSAAGGHYAAVLAKDPGLFRRLGLRLPVRVEDDGSGLARRAASLVKGSPRFRPEDGPFRITLTGGRQPRACLLGQRGEQYSCASVNLPVDTSDKVGARLLVAELHQAAFSLKSDLSQGDLTSLDGSPTAARADRQIRSLVDKLGGN